MEASWIAVIVILTFVGCATIAALVVGSIALNKVNGEPSVIVVVPTPAPVPSSSPVQHNTTQTGTATILMPDSQTLPTEPQVVTFAEAFSELPIVHTVGTFNLSGNPCTLKTGPITETGFTATVVGFPTINGNPVKTTTTPFVAPTILAVVEFTTASNVVVPGILYEDLPNLYYISAKDTAGVTWNAEQKVNTGGVYISGSGALINLNGLPTAVFRQDATHIVTAQGTDTAWSTAVTPSVAVVVSSSLLAVIPIYEIPQFLPTASKLGVFFFDATNVLFATSANVGVTWSTTVVAIAAPGVVTNLKGAAILNNAWLPAVIARTAANVFFGAGSDTLGTTPFPVTPAPSPAFVTTDILSLSSVVLDSLGRAVPVINAQNAGGFSVFLAATAFDDTGIASFVGSTPVQLGSTGGTGSTLGKSIGFITTQSNFLSVYLETAGSSLRYSVFPNGSMSNAAILADSTDIDPINTGQTSVDMTIIDGGISFGFAYGGALFYLRPPTATINVDNNFSVTYRATGLVV